MRLPQLLSSLATYVAQKDGTGVAEMLERTGGPKDRNLVMSIADSRRLALQREVRGRVPSPWDDLTLTHLQALVNEMDGDAVAAYSEQVTLVNGFLRLFSNLTDWSLPILYTLIRDLRLLALKADDQLTRQGQKAGKLEDASRIVQKAFTACMTDRSALETSRKWGTYHVIGILFKMYFELKSIALCKNVLRALSVGDMPGLEQYTRSDQVTFCYYVGVLNFLNEDYEPAEKDLLFAFQNCHREAKRNQELILSYLLPVLLLRGKHPTDSLLSAYPRLAHIYKPFLVAFREGNVREYDRALYWAEKPLVGMGAFLAVERAREGCMRSLFRRVWLSLDRSTRIKVSSFQRALAFAGVEVDSDEVEAYLANMIYKGYMKGYISHEKQTVVLSNVDPFPKLSTFAVPC